MYNSSGLAYYRHADHLGSSRLATTPTRTKYYDVAYAPYGEDYNGSGTQDLAFTDENQDTVKGGWSTNLYDFMLREYRTAHGRWTSPDPAGLAAVDPAGPQTWNRYSYVANNPLAMVDLLGDDGCYDGGGGLDGLLGSAYLMTWSNGTSAWFPTSSGPSGNGLTDLFNTGCGNPGGNWGPGGGGSGIFEGENSVNVPVGSGNPLTDLWQGLGLPSGLSCPVVGGISSFLCGGVNPIMDAELGASPCLAGAGPLQVGQSRCYAVANVGMCMGPACEAIWAAQAGGEAFAALGQSICNHVNQAADQDIAIAYQDYKLSRMVSSVSPATSTVLGGTALVYATTGNLEMAGWMALCR